MSNFSATCTGTVYHGDYKLQLMLLHTRQASMLSWIFIILAHWNNSPCIDMSPQLDTLSIIGQGNHKKNHTLKKIKRGENNALKEKKQWHTKKNVYVAKIYLKLKSIQDGCRRVRAWLRLSGGIILLGDPKCHTPALTTCVC